MMVSASIPAMHYRGAGPSVFHNGCRLQQNLELAKRSAVRIVSFQDGASDVINNSGSPGAKAVQKYHKGLAL